MRILFANNIRGYFGGVEQVVADAARGLASRGHACYLAYAVTGRNVPEFSQPFAACWTCPDFGEAVEEGPGTPFEAIVKEARPDVIYFHKIRRLPASLPALRVRTVRMIHDHELYCACTHKYFRHGRRICHHPMGWRCYADAGFLERRPGSRLGFGFSSIAGKGAEMRRNFGLDLLLANSTFVRDHLVLNGFPPEKVRVLHPIPILEDPPFAPVPEDPRILYMGQLHRGKGVDLLLRALHQVSCPFQATIVGTGNAEARLKALTRTLGLENRVGFKGWVGHEDVGGFYAAAKVLVVPSRWPEPFGLIGIEAMRHGRAVVAFDVGGICDWLEPDATGLLVPEQDTGALARAIERLLTEPGLAARLGRNAFARVRERFSTERYLDQLEHFLERGLGSMAANRNEVERTRT